MNLSMKWLADYVALPETDMRSFAHALTMSGSKVECFSKEGEEISGVVVGKILKIEPHPDSDHLLVCLIDVGSSDYLQIVTGAQNVKVGEFVPVATDGSTLPNGVKIKKGKLRGMSSEGMLCSISELGVTLHDFPYAIEDGIFLLDEDCSVGDDIHDAIGLNDTTVEFEITSNRPDCMSIIGLAREVAATYDLPISIKQPEVKFSSDDIAHYIDVTVQAPDLCPRYTARVIKNVRIAPSPRWMRERLRACGVRPINNLVDITNYVMLEYGQPLHAFDYSCLDGKKIIVRRAGKDEPMQTLDGVDHILNDKMLVIADEKKAVAVAGVMGGENSAITDTTQTVVFESAAFLGSSVRITARELAMRTDASARFEKGLDPKGTMDAVMRACELVELLDAGEVVEGIIDVDNSPSEPVTVGFEPDWTNRFLGIELSRQEMTTILQKLGFTVSGDTITVPSFRTDVFHKADIAEEIARIYGYEKIPTTAVRGVARGTVTREQGFERMIHKALQACGCYEVSTYSFISPKAYDKINLPKNSKLRQCVCITNPLGEDSSVMRTSVLPSMLDVLSRNYNNRNQTFSCYELGNEYIPIEGQTLPDENLQAIIGSYGKGDFYSLKGIVEALLAALYICDYDVHPVNDDPTFHPGRTAAITKNGTHLGILGEVHPAVLENYSIGARAYIAKLDVKALLAASADEVSYKAMPRFPASTRDLSLICDKELPVIEIEKAIKASVGNILEAVTLFDVYQGAQIAEDKKSVSYSIVMRSPSATLTDTEADAAIKRVLKALKDIDVELRG